MNSIQQMQLRGERAISSALRQEQKLKIYRVHGGFANLMSESMSMDSVSKIQRNPKNLYFLRVGYKNVVN